MDAVNNKVEQVEALLSKRKRVGLTFDENKRLIRLFSELIDAETDRAQRSNWYVLRGVTQANLRRQQREKEFRATAA